MKNKIVAVPSVDCFCYQHWVLRWWIFVHLWFFSGMFTKWAWDRGCFLLNTVKAFDLALCCLGVNVACCQVRFDSSLVLSKGSCNGASKTKLEKKNLLSRPCMTKECIGFFQDFFKKLLEIILARLTDS